MKVHSLKIVRATYSFVWGNPLECLRILWLPLLLMFLLAWIVWPHILRFVNACVRGAAATSISSSSAVAVSLWVVFLFAGFTVLMSIMCAGLWRLILRNVHVNAPFYLGFGNDELRLLALAGLKVLMLFAWAVVTAVVIGLVEFVVAHFSGFSPSALLLTFLISLPVLGWIDTRLSLSGPASIQTEHVDIAGSWHVTDHNISLIRRVGALLMAPAAILILVLVFLLISLLMHGITVSDCALFLASRHSTEKLQGVHVRLNPGFQLLIPGRFCVGVGTGAQHGNKQRCWPGLPRRGVIDNLKASPETL